jgi:hypothetical protein
MALLKTLRLFGAVVWRPSPAGGVMSLRTAWRVARIVHGPGVRRAARGGEK